MARRRFSTRDVTALLARFDGRCAECGTPIGPATGLELDHVIPLELGGDDTLDNLQPLCRRDHAAKTKVDVGRIAKAKRVAARHVSAHQPRSSLTHPTLKRRVDGVVVPRHQKET